ncbi:MAG: hypothetical protein ACLQBX_03605 [Candidatus Limnocylindrales bacterium]
MKHLPSRRARLEWAAKRRRKQLWRRIATEPEPEPESPERRIDVAFVYTIPPWTRDWGALHPPDDVENALAQQSEGNDSNAAFWTHEAVTLAAASGLDGGLVLDQLIAKYGPS